jgi:flavodoxin
MKGKTMNTLVVHYSKYGNTQMVAETIAAAMRAAAGTGSQHITVKRLDKLTADDMQDINLLVAGVPTHNMNLPKPVPPLLAELPKKALRGIYFATYDTSYKLSRWLQPFTAAKPLARKLRKLGGKIILPPETFTVEGHHGPLYDGELERVHVWAEQILTTLHAKNGK